MYVCMYVCIYIYIYIYIGAFASKRIDVFMLVGLCVPSLRRGHANILCIVPSLTDDPRRQSEDPMVCLLFHPTDNSQLI